MANGGLSFVTYTTIDDEAKASSRASSTTSKKKDSSGDEFTLKDFVKDIGNALKGMDLLDVDAESILEKASIDLMVGQAMGGTTPERLT
jgi:BRCT domain type II-containing protein